MLRLVVLVRHSLGNIVLFVPLLAVELLMVEVVHN